MLHDKTIGFIGSGNMGEALINGLISSKRTASGNIICSDVRSERLQELEQRFAIRTTTHNREVIQQADIIIYAVKPQIIGNVIKETADEMTMDKLVISIAAGISLEFIESSFQKELRLVRAMPNVCVAVKEGAIAISAVARCKDEDIDLAMAIFNSVGRCVSIKNEALMDAVTGLSASGPAYIFVLMDALADAGVNQGLARNEALLLASQTVLGAAKMLMETGVHPGELKDMVTSPGGTTIAGLHALETGGLRAIVMNAVQAAAIRSGELGKKA
jgi:pyrroline-5-carboxylate reductase